jgi:5-methylcytosine-specific restriction endonuclease McrA
LPTAAATAARGRCECCGAHEHLRALEVNHIIPRNQGASDAISNLQALCFRCNAGKRDGCLPTQEGAPTSAAVTARKDDAPAADQAAITNVVGMMLFSGGGGLIQTTSG